MQAITRSITAALITCVSGQTADAQQAAMPPVLEVTATDYAFRAPASVPAGWTRLRFMNEGKEPHFVFMSRLPAGRTIADYERELSPVFAGAWEAVRGGATTDQAMERLMQELPPWFPELQMVGGPGLVAPGGTSESMLRLEPGNYVMECYVKTEDGRIHYMEGMVRPLTVTADRTPAAAPPHPDIAVTLSNNELTLSGDVTAGRRVFAVYWKENPEQGFGHSAHLARLKPDTSVDEVVAWMNWFGLKGLAAPAPAEFLGGLHFMPTGETAYFTADLEPGRYLLVSENTAHLGVYREFTVR